MVAVVNVALVKLKIFIGIAGRCNVSRQVAVVLQAASLATVEFEIVNIDPAWNAGLTIRAMGTINKITTAAEAFINQQAV